MEHTSRAALYTNVIDESLEVDMLEDAAEPRQSRLRSRYIVAAAIVAGALVGAALTLSSAREPLRSEAPSAVESLVAVGRNLERKQAKLGNATKPHSHVVVKSKATRGETHDKPANHHAGAKHAGAQHAGADHTSTKVTTLAPTTPASTTEPTPPPCAKLWGQCGGHHPGESWTGPTCCEEGDCVDWNLGSLPNFRMCRNPSPPECEMAAPGSQCANIIQETRENLAAHPELYHGVTQDMEDAEFQLMLHWAQSDRSQCPEPCGPSTCFVALHVVGCDTLNTWYCDHDDGSLKFACCCNYFHEEKWLDPPENVDDEMANAMKAMDSDEPSLFCTAMCQPHGYELELLRAQYAEGKLGLFGCNEWAVYSNESLILSPKNETPSLKTGLISGSLSADMGGNWGTALNTDVFIRFWDKVISDPKAWKVDWVVKVDPDTMWLPLRLRALLRTTHGPLSEPEPEGGLFLNNCQVGLHGPIEVLSKKALGTYKEGRLRCREGEVSEIGQEDYFLRKCFELLDITKVDAYNLMLEATLACQEVPSMIYPDRPPCFAPQVAFHPFKSTYTWMRCHQEAMNHPYQLPVNPITEGPNVDNEFHG